MRNPKEYVEQTTEELLSQSRGRKSEVGASAGQGTPLPLQLMVAPGVPWPVPTPTSLWLHLLCTSDLPPPFS